MIDDPNQRTRAILWCIADTDPNLPVIEALGVLKAVEAELRRLELEAQARAEKASEYRGSAGVTAMVRDYSNPGPVRDAAEAGDAGKVAGMLRDLTGCSPAVASQAATSLVSLHGPRAAPRF